MLGVWNPSGPQDELKYRLLAYIVVRDALAFYVGIPEFLQSFDRLAIIEDRVRAKQQANPGITEAKLARYRKFTTKAVDRRIADLEADFTYCQTVLFEDNHWLQLLNLDPSVVKRLLSQTSADILKGLAVVPNWRDSDEELRRPYQRMEYNAANPKFK